MDPTGRPTGSARKNLLQDQTWKQKVQQLEGIRLSGLHQAAEVILPTSSMLFVQGTRFDLNCDILDGHMSTCLPHLGNIAYRVGETLEFNGEFEKLH